MIMMPYQRVIVYSMSGRHRVMSAKILKGEGLYLKLKEKA